MTDGSDHLAILLHLSKVPVNFLLASFIRPLQGSLGESLLLGSIPGQTKLHPDSSWGRAPKSGEQERRALQAPVEGLGQTRGAT